MTHRLCMIVAACVVFAALNGSGAVENQNPQNEQDEIRRIWDDGLVKKRPPSRGARVPNHVYKRMTTRISVSRASASDSVLGLTLWKLRPSVSSDRREIRDLIHPPSSSRAIQMTAERLQSESSITEGELVRISIESPGPGYLYVIDREQYSDGSLGAPTLIFPTQRINNGQNRVLAGRVIQIPAPSDNPEYLAVSRNPARNDQVAEILTILVTRTPLDIPIPSEAAKLSKDQVSSWESQWRAPIERLELEGGVHAARTLQEKLAVRQGRLLRQHEAPPQTIYRVGKGANAPILIDVKLSFNRQMSGALHGQR